MRIADQFLDGDYIDTGPKHKDKVGTESREVEYIYNGIEFPTEQEMHEYMQENPPKQVRIIEDDLEKLEEDMMAKDYMVYCIKDNARLYLSKSRKAPYTFQVNEAKRFTEKAAKKAAYFASKNGVNHWEIISINKN